jgi:hypothetical protein
MELLILRMNDDEVLVVMPSNTDVFDRGNNKLCFLNC